jgi:hypothetical protein
MGDESSINKAVLHYANAHRGKLLGRGECWDLPEKALADTKKAQTSTDIMVGVNLNDDSVDYVWGDEIQVKDMLAGDIIQFRDWNVVVKTETTYPDGTSYSIERTLKRPHHSAIALTSPDKDGVFKVLEQWHKHRVQEGTIHTRDTVSESDGIEDFKHNKIPPGKDFDKIRQHLKKTGATKFHRTITITTPAAGKYWVYRPKAK